MPVIRDVTESIGDAVFDAVGRTLGRRQERRDLPSDTLESDDAYLVVFDAPGADREDVQITYEDRRLLVRVERFRPLRESFEMTFPGRGLSLEGRVTLPEGPPVEATAAEATLESNGTLLVRLPKGDGDHDESTAVDGETSEDSRDDGA
ncbi:heat-shock protein Hsp20 [Halobacteriales archaeon QH_10_67_13]|nr:MAG: heat-shock protein Hsp20 [Halobacteriales archaeon QH_10_67_13]